MSTAQKEEFKQTFITILRDDPEFRKTILEELKKEVKPILHTVDDSTLDEVIEDQFTRFDDVFKALA